MLDIGRLFRRSKQDAGENSPSSWEEVDAAGPPQDRESIHEPMVVSPTHAKEIMLDVPDSSAEGIVNIVNDLALKDVSNSSPKPKVPSKRKRQDTDVVDRTSKKRVAKGTGNEDTRDEHATTSINGDTRRQGRSSRTSPEAVKAAPGKLPRPKKQQQKRHIANIYPAVQGSHSKWSWTPPGTPKQQTEKTATPPTTPTRNPPNSEATPRRRGRPRRAGASPTEKTTLTNKGQRRNTQKMNAKPGEEERPEGYLSPETESREVHEVSDENSSQKGGPRAEQKASETRTPPSNKRRTAYRRSTRSVASANGQKDVILNANIDLTKKPERDARRAAKQLRNLELASEPLAQKGDRTVARKAKSTKSPVRAGARKASPKVQNHVVSEEREDEEQEASEREERIHPVEAIDRDGQMSDYLDEREEGGAEGEAEESASERSSQVVKNAEEAEGQEEMELFGANRAWKTILEGAQSVCSSKLPLNRVSKPLTKTIRDLVHDVKEASEVYEQLSSFRGIEHDSIVELNLLKEFLDAIDLKITDLSEERAATNGSKMIRDIYKCAIPAVVFLLQSALQTRLYHSDAPCDLEKLSSIVTSLEEIIRLQEMAMELCDKAGTWKSKPVPTSRPIIWPTTRKMYPNLRLVQGAFFKILLEQKRNKKIKENALKTAQKQEELLRSSQQVSQEAARINDIRNRKLRESIEKEAEKLRNAKTSYRQSRANEMQPRIQSQQVNGRIESSDHWTEDEDIELYIQLKRGYDPGLTSTFTGSHPLCQRSSLITLVANERYLKILNAPALQNKLPQHIRKRALYDKTFLLDQEGPLEWITSIE